MNPLLFLIACSTTPEAEQPPTPTAAATAPAVPEEEPPPLRCPATVDQLTPTPFLVSDDPRLQEANLIVINKSVRSLQLFSQGISTNCWTVGLGFAPEGHKQQEGDGRTPEGWYRTSDKPWSSFYNAIAVHYPNTNDAANGLAEGRISEAQRRAIGHALNRDDKPPQTTPLGGEILIHGGGSTSDWTLGCVALNNDHIDSLRSQIPANMRTNVLILP